MRSKQRFGKADAAGISVVQVQVWFEKFPDGGRGCVFQAGRIEILRCALQGRSALRRSNVRRAFGIGSGRALTNGGAKVAAVAHQEKNRKSGVEGKRVDLGGRRIIKKKKKKKMKEIGAR